MIAALAFTLAFLGAVLFIAFMLISIVCWYVKEVIEPVDKEQESDTFFFDLINKPQ